jgi:hypothetical protein
MSTKQTSKGERRKQLAKNIARVVHDIGDLDLGVWHVEIVVSPQARSMVVALWMNRADTCLGVITDNDEAAVLEALRRKGMVEIERASIDAPPFTGGGKPTTTRVILLKGPLEDKQVEKLARKALWKSRAPRILRQPEAAANQGGVR